ncbi:MAG TPA: sigma-70 family RNA polymerase sigma factor [Verrucomicrobiae bacterium]|nr:sigma-70 family RNA polymerase sigma factor [Verrucomicrobiae bacterium]
MTTANQKPESTHDVARPVFVTTHWSLVLSARDKKSPQSAGALEKLCRVYWYPLYAYVRRSGQSKENAEDLTQAFFTRLLEKDFLNSAEQERGRFRSFLLVALKRFLANEWDKAKAQKRGGFQTHVALDTDFAERKFQSEISSGEISPDRAFEKRWVLTLLEQTMSRLRSEFQQDGKITEFEHLKIFLTADKKEIPYAKVAGEMQMNDAALRVAVHRLRKRYRELFREEIAHTLADGESVDEELRHLLAILSE